MRLLNVRVAALGEGGGGVLVSICRSAKMKGDCVTLKVLYTSLKARAILAG